jgi:hypothetical protein
MAEFYDYRPCGADVENYDITAQFSQNNSITILLSEHVFIKISPIEARALIGALKESIDDFKEYAESI